MKGTFVRKLAAYGLLPALVIGIIFLSVSCQNKQASGSPAPSAKAASSSSEPVTIHFYHWTSPESIDVMLQTFKQKFPKINVVYTVLADSAAATGNVIMASGSPVDVMGEASLDTVRQRVQANMYAPIDSYMKAEGIDFTKMGGMNVKDLEMINDHYYSLPYGLTTYALFFNKELFDKAGVAYPTDDTTWEQLRTIAKKVTSGSGTTKIYGLLYSFANQWMFPVIEQLGPNYCYSADGKSSSFDNPAFLNTLQMFYDMEMVDGSTWPQSQFAALNMESNRDQTFLQGKVAMYIGYPFTPYWTGLGITAANPKGAYGYTGFKYACVNLPKVKAGDPLKNVFYTSDLSIAINSQHKDEAWTFMNYFCLGDPISMAKKKGMMYVSMQGTVAPDLQTQIADALFNYPGFDKQSGINTYLIDKPLLQPQYTSIQTAKQQINTMVSSEVISCMTGNETPKQAIDNMKKKADALIKTALAQ